MKKRLLPALLALVLASSLVATAFAKTIPMTLVQQTTGEGADLNKEFVYYIKTEDVEIDESAPNVEIVTKFAKQCDCGFTVYELDPDWRTMWYEHKLGCTRRYIQITTEYYKIILKNGEKIKFGAKNVLSKEVCSVQQDDYSLSFSMDDQFLKLFQYGAVTAVMLRISENGTVIIRRERTADSAPISFTDVPAGAFYADAVDWAVGQDITNGTGGSLFSPGRDCTHLQILTFLYRAAQGGGNKATAADQDRAVTWARKMDMIGEGFNPSVLCTRADAVNYIWRAFGKTSVPASHFSDVPSGADYAKAVDWAVANGVTDGTGGGKFSPDTVCNRGTIVTFLHRAYVSSARLK